MTLDPPRYTLSFAQERLWFLEKLNSGSHNVNLAFRIDGVLMESALLVSLRQIVARHTIYRTVFREEQGVAYQSVQDQVSLPFERIDLTHMPFAEQETVVAERIDSEVGRKFSLHTAPLFFVTLLALDPLSHVLLITKHHIITDGWSIGLFNDELSRNYEAIVAGKTAPMPRETAPYTDYAVTQRRAIDRGEADAQLSYWLDELEGETNRLRLVSQANRSLLATRRGGAVELSLDRSARDRLMALRRTYNATWFVVLLAGLGALLNRLSGQPGVLIGSPVAGRGQDWTHEILGLFLNTLVFQVRHHDDATIGELIAKAKRCMYDAYEHQDLPFEKLVDELAVERDLERNPLFDVLLNVTSRAWTELSLSGASTRILHPRRIVANFGIALYAVDQVDSFNLRLHYQEGVLTREEAGELLCQLVHLLDQTVDRPDAALTELSLSTRKAREVLPNPTTTLAAGQYEPVTEAIAAQCAADPGRAAIAENGSVMTYGELIAAARTLARTLLSRGLQPGNVVSITGSSSPGLVVCGIGVLLARGVILFIDSTLPVERRRMMIEGAEAVWQISIEHAPVDAPLAAGERTFVVAADTGRIIGHHPDSRRLEKSELPRVRADDASYVFFTSGTTGRPRAVKGSHRSLSHFLRWQKDTFRIAPGDRISQLTNTMFDVVLREIFLPLSSGATLSLPNRNPAVSSADLHRVMEWIAADGITVLHAVPTLLELWMEQGDPSSKVKSVRLIFSAGEALTGAFAERIRERFPSAEIVNLYGPTEATLAKSYFRLSQPTDPWVQPLGHALPETQLLVLKQSGRLCGINEIGEIFVRSPHLTMGYLDSATTPPKPFIVNPHTNDAGDLLCPTGDAGYYRVDGLLAFDGRMDNQLKIRGVRISPSEISAAVMICDQILACEVIPNPEGTGLIACIVAGEEQPPTESELRARLSKLLPPAMVPGRIVQLDELPVTANGKVDRSALAVEVSGLDKPPCEPHAAPRTGFEADIVGLWQKLLGCDRIGIHDNFFTLGGHSVLALQLAYRVYEEFGVEISLRDVFEHPTVADLGVIVTMACLNKLEAGEQDRIISEV